MASVLRFAGARLAPFTAPSRGFFTPSSFYTPTQPTTCSFVIFTRFYAVAANPNKNVDLTKLRNIGISAHIDSGKTTLTERILFYTGRINDIHEVKGKDGEGAKMDFMDLERERGITIQSAATYCSWGDHKINIIDTPGHVDFTIEVERALRVLDGAILVICGVGGVQSQTFTVDRQMRRYSVPRLSFINKLDRTGADPWLAISQLRDKLNLNAAAVQIPIGLENNHTGIVDLVTEQAYVFEGYKGNEVKARGVPANLKEQVAEKRAEMIERVANVDDQLGEWMIMNDYPNVQPPVDILKGAIRRAVIARKFVAVFMGSAFKNIGVQALLDGVVDYLPNPADVTNKALDLANGGEKEITLLPDPTKPLVGLAFKLEEGRFGQLTYMRIYQGHIKRGDMVKNVNLDRTVKVPRLVKMHANEMEEIQEAGPGEICALFGVECYSGNTFSTANSKVTMTSMHVPAPVISLSLTPTKKSDATGNFGKALNRFQKEDPTFRVKTDPDSGQTIISGMGELHLSIYVERMKREYGVEANTGRPLVAYKETISQQTAFDFTHKKQTGGAGQYARITGYVEPLGENADPPLEFEDATVGGSIPPNFMEAIRKGFLEGSEKGPMVGSAVVGLRMVVNGGDHHPVDSSDLAFRTCTRNALQDAIKKAKPIILEPIMNVEVQTPLEFQGAVVGQLAKRKGIIDTTTQSSSEFVTITTFVPLANMFGYSTDLRSMTQGKAEYAMEYKEHQPVPKSEVPHLVEEAARRKAEEAKNK